MTMTMKKTVLFCGILAVAALLFGKKIFPFGNGDPKEKEALIVQTLISGLATLHYSPKTIDDNFSKEVYKVYIDRLDGARRFLTQEDVNQLKKYELLIDDETNNGSYQLFDLSTDLFDKSLTKTQGYYREILAQPIDFSKDESIELDGEKRGFAKNDSELYEYWKRLMKYEVLNKLVDKEEAQDKETDKAKAKKTPAELEIAARKDVLKTFDDWYKRMAKQNRMDKLSDYLNCITTVYDPHTGYFEPKDKEKFDQEMAGSFEGIGARLQADGDYIKVSEVMPGGPAWQQKELEADDVIQKVAQGSAEPVDIAGMDRMML